MEGTVQEMVDPSGLETSVPLLFMPSKLHVGFKMDDSVFLLTTSPAKLTKTLVPPPILPTDGLMFCMINGLWKANCFAAGFVNEMPSMLKDTFTCLAAGVSGVRHTKVPTPPSMLLCSAITTCSPNLQK